VQQLREDGVTELDLSNKRLHAPAAVLVAYLIPATSVLKNCKLLENRFDVESATMLAKIGAEKGIMLSGMTRDQTVAKFTTQNLHRPLRPADAILIASDLKFMVALTTLDLSASWIGPEGAQAIAEVLKANAVLTNLELYGNNIGDDGARAIAEALKVNTAVTTLRLMSNDIGVEGAIAIAEALKVNKVLAVLWLEDNSIGEDGAKAVQEAVEDRNGFDLVL
jgi:Ran GTPase-activating protein (RanGAP) involved in mRNA processing and transport